MAEYIHKSDTEAAFREVRKRLYAKKKDYVAIEFLIRDQMLSVAEEIIHAIPVADAVEVIRCKDCRFFAPDTYGDVWCSAKSPGVSKGMFSPSGDSYCSDAERR